MKKQAHGKALVTRIRHSQSQGYAPSWLLAKPVLPPTDCESQQPESQPLDSESQTAQEPESADADPYQVENNDDDDYTKGFAARVAAAKNAAHARAKKAAQDAEAKKVAEEAKAKKAAEDAEAMRVAEEAQAKKAAEDAEAMRVAEKAKAKKAALDAAKKAKDAETKDSEAKGDDSDDDGAKQGLKRKAMEMIADPKFKKGTKTKMLDLSPNSQKVMKGIRRVRAIENSNRWHDTWDSKGKPREREQPESPGPASGHSDGSGGQEHKDAGADVEEQEHGGSGGNANPQGDGQGGPRTWTLKDARVTWSTIFILQVVLDNSYLNGSDYAQE